MATLEKHLRLAIDAAQAAGELLRAEFHRPGGPRGAGSHADADELAEELIRERIVEAFPDHGILGEEKGYRPARNADAPVWLIDPNDGTVSYLSGFRGSAVSIALIQAGLPVLGVVFAYGAPNDKGDLIAHAEGCGPILRNGRPCPDRRSWAEALSGEHTVFVSQSADRNSHANALLAAPARFRAMASIAYRLALVAAGEGEAAVSLSGPVQWDYAGGHALMRAVGGELLDGSGRPITYSREGRSSSNGRCFGGSPVIAAELAKKDWSAVYSTSGTGAEKERYALARPVKGFAVADAGLLSRAQGCLLGQLSGDALGELAEFLTREETARHFPGDLDEMVDGGAWDTIAGQPTDDSELALMLARDLVQQKCFDPASVARAYVYWKLSHPFDIGNTTRAALTPAAEALEGNADVAAAARASAVQESQANGALMRISPLAIFGHAAEASELAQWAREDALLTHPHPVCQDASAVFVVTIAHALRTGQSRVQLYRFAIDWAAENKIHPDVQQTLAAAETTRPAYHKNMGWVRVALQNAFWQLLHAGSFEDGVVDTVMQGGDTDTNAAIAGALLGAVHGVESVPRQWLDRVLTCRPLKGLPGVRRDRPACFWPVDALVLAEHLLLMRK